MNQPSNIPPRQQRELLRAKPGLKVRAREMRASLSKPEAWLWKKLQRRQTGFLFHRQKPLGPFVADFYCHEARLVVETDGYCHSQRGDEDRARDAWMTARGIKVLRIPAKEVFRDLDGVVAGITGECRRQATIWKARRDAARAPHRTSPGLEDSATPSAGAEGDETEPSP